MRSLSTCSALKHEEFSPIAYCVINCGVDDKSMTNAYKSLMVAIALNSEPVMEVSIRHWWAGARKGKRRFDNYRNIFYERSNRFIETLAILMHLSISAMFNDSLSSMARRTFIQSPQD